MKKMFLLASLFIVAMSSCKKDDNTDIIVDKPKDTTSQVVKDITVNFTATLKQEGVHFNSIAIEIQNPNILDEYNLPICAASGEVRSPSMSFKVENPENFQGVVKVLFVCYGRNDNDDIRKQIIIKSVDLTKESNFNFTFSDLK
jgi:hypothetical protein